MKHGKTKLTRQSADVLFPDLKPSGTQAGSRPDNPFGDSTSHTSSPFADSPFGPLERPERDKKSLWKENLVSLPKGIELPPGYESAAKLRSAMERAWRMKWVREASHEIVAEFPEGWSAIRPASGPVQLRDANGVARAVYGWAEDAELRVLPRYVVESQENSSSGLGSLIVRDRESGQILERSAVWSAQTGNHHPDWAKLSAWLDRQYPQHRDPLRLWSDCEANLL
ncbi:hypothetical protein P3T18_005270 [Paraburkholderia sp. GAS199]|uniref:hypothetical protein n=1 Tax=Paraburkholderia sp. GAS199 TaxID=3035126 RepID=UPI003D1E9823